MRLLTTLAGLSLAITSAAALAAPQSITVFDGTAVTPTPNPSNPMVAVDSDNRSHVVWTMDIDENATTYHNIFYKLIAADGTTLIDATQLSDTTGTDDSRKPQIAVSGTDTVYVTWHTDGNNISLIGLNPALDDLSGDAATLATIERFAEKTEFTSTETGGGNDTSHSYIDTDSTGRVHILVEEKDDTEMFCAVYNADGTVATALTAVIPSHMYRGGHPAIALDENDKMHVAHLLIGATNKEVAYSLVDCAAGTTLIDATIVSTDDTVSSMQSTMAYDAGTVYIAWVDTVVGDNETCSGGTNPNFDVDNDCTEADNELRFIALTPALDDQSGDAATLATITKVAEKSIPSLPGEDEWYLRMGMMETGDLQLLYYADASTENLFGTILDTNGDVVTAATEIMNDDTTGEVTGKTRASVSNRATVYPEAQMIKMTLRDIIVEEVEEVEEEKKTKKGDGFLGLGMSLWLLLGVPTLIGLLRLSRRK